MILALIKTYIHTQEWGVSVTDLTILLAGGMWILRFGLGKQSNVLSRNKKDSRADSSVNYDSLAHEDSKGKSTDYCVVKRLFL